MGAHDMWDEAVPTRRRARPARRPLGVYQRRDDAIRQDVSRSPGDPGYTSADLHEELYGTREHPMSPGHPRWRAPGARWPDTRTVYPSRVPPGFAAQGLVGQAYRERYTRLAGDTYEGFPAAHGRMVASGLQARHALEVGRGMVWGKTEVLPPARVGSAPNAADMALRNAVEIAQYAQRTAQMIGAGTPVPGWVAHKLSRARTDLGDVRHFLQHGAPPMKVGAKKRRRKKSWLARLLGR